MRDLSVKDITLMHEGVFIHMTVRPKKIQSRKNNTKTMPVKAM